MYSVNLFVAFAAPILTAIMVLTSGCATVDVANDKVRGYLRHVNDQYDCVGIEVGDGAAFCVDDIAITVTVTF